MEPTQQEQILQTAKLVSELKAEQDELYAALAGIDKVARLLHTQVDTVNAKLTENQRTLRRLAETFS